MRNMNEEQRTHFSDWLNTPVHEVTPDRPKAFTEEQEAESFMNFMSQQKAV